MSIMIRAGSSSEGVAGLPGRSMIWAPASSDCAAAALPLGLRSPPAAPCSPGAALRLPQPSRQLPLLWTPPAARHFSVYEWLCVRGWHLLPGTHKCARLKVAAVAIYVIRIAPQNKRVIVRCFHWLTVCMEIRDCAAELNVFDQHRQGHELVMRGCLRRLQTQAFQSATCTRSEAYSQLLLFQRAPRYSRSPLRTSKKD